MMEWSELKEITTLRLIDRDQTRTFDPNTLIEAVYTNSLHGLIPLDAEVSVISGTPAIIYKTCEHSIALSVDELHRLILKALTPDEFFALRHAFGNFFEIHNDFYDPDTGFAFQPAVDTPQFWPCDGSHIFFIFKPRNSLDDPESIFRTTLFALVEQSGYNCHTLALEPESELGSFQDRLVFDPVARDTSAQFTFRERLNYNPHVKKAVVLLTSDVVDEPELVTQIRDLFKKERDVLLVLKNVTQSDAARYIPEAAESNFIEFQELDARAMYSLESTEDGTVMPHIDMRKAPRHVAFVQQVLWQVIQPAQILKELTESRSRIEELEQELIYAENDLTMKVEALEKIKSLAGQVVGSSADNQAVLLRQIISIAHHKILFQNWEEVALRNHEN